MTIVTSSARVVHVMDGHLRAQDNGRTAIGLVLAVVITAASVQDRDAARPLLWNLHAASAASA